MPRPKEGEVLVRTLWLSLDPYMRGRMREGKSYARPVEIGEVMTGGVVGKIMESRSPALNEGDIVEGGLGWQTHTAADPRTLHKVDTSLGPIQTALGVLGMPGMTAYFGLLEVGRPIPGDTVVVSAASGAVGQVVGQIAKIMGCRVVGIVGSEAKRRFILDQLKFDAGIDYRSQDVGNALDAYCSDGIDVYFDNVGGPITDLVMQRLNPGGRISVCGQISQYNLPKPEFAPRNATILITKQIRMQGFLVFQYENRYEEGRKRIAKWMRDGILLYKEDVVEGLENAPGAFIGLLKGRNFGKLLVRVSDE